MPIDFSLTPQQRDLQSQARTFARDVLSQVHRATHSHPTAIDRFYASRPFYEQMVAAGFLRKSIPREFGGEATGLLDLAIMAEEFYAVDSSVSLTLFGTVLGLLPVLYGGTNEQRATFLAPFLRREGAPLAAFASSEPGGSANAGSPPPGEGIRTTAELIDGTWLIRGSKRWVSSATGWDGIGADLLCVMCRAKSGSSAETIPSIIAVEKPSSGILLESVIEALGHRAHLVPQFRLDDVRVPESNRLEGLGGGLRLSEFCFTGTAGLVGIFGAGLMRAAFAFALDFARTERRGGIDPIIEHQAVGYALADAKASIEAVRSLAWRACHAFDSRSPAALELAIHAKIFGSETAVRVITDLMRIVGVESYDGEAVLGRLLQDALALPVFGGGNIGVRRRQLHAMLRKPEFDPLASLNAA